MGPECRALPRRSPAIEWYTDFGSMYRGITPPLVGVTPIFAISFWVSNSPTGPIGKLPIGQEL